MSGETYMHQKDYEQALKAFHRVETQFEYPRWQAAALLQAGKCHELNGEPQEAIKMFTQVTAQHADTSFAKEASERLDKLNGHGS
jgi:TolA-binding protein